MKATDIREEHERWLKKAMEEPVQSHIVVNK